MFTLIVWFSDGSGVFMKQRRCKKENQFRLDNKIYECCFFNKSWLSSAATKKSHWNDKNSEVINEPVVQKPKSKSHFVNY